MKNILVLMGGESTEHDISLITGVQAINNFDKEKYKVFPVVIDKQGLWHFSFDFVSVDKILGYFKNPKKRKEVVLLADKMLYIKTKNRLKNLCHIDCAFLCCHGGFGENGAIQGFLECVNVPFVSPSHTESGLFMDKNLSKILFKNLGINTTDWLVINKEDYAKNKNHIIDSIKEKLPGDKFIKPNSQGSSIGVGLAKDDSTLLDSIEKAFLFDNYVIVEKAVKNLYELNIAVTKINDEVVLSQIEKPINKNEVLSFSDKYISNSKSGLNNMGRQLPAKISKKLQTFVESSAKLVYTNFIKKGIVRIDYLVDKKSNDIYINEVNTIPGSMSYYLWDKYSFGSLIDNLIEQSQKEQDKLLSLQKSFESSVLEKFGKGQKLNKL